MVAAYREVLTRYAPGKVVVAAYVTAPVARLVEAANKVSRTRDRTTLLRVVNG